MDVAGVGTAKSVAEHPISITFDVLFPLLRSWKSNQHSRRGAGCNSSVEQVWMLNEEVSDVPK
jgi:hypothetical protein